MGQAKYCLVLVLIAFFKLAHGADLDNLLLRNWL
jgi:hypothetical protein